MVNEITDPKATYLVIKIIINQEKTDIKKILLSSSKKLNLQQWRLPSTHDMDIKRITPNIVATPLPPLNFNQGENICPNTTEEPSINISSSM